MKFSPPNRDHAHHNFFSHIKFRYLGETTIDQKGPVFSFDGHNARMKVLLPATVQTAVQFQ